MKTGGMALALLATAASVSAQSLDGPRTWTVDGIMVTEGDVTNCPYHEIGTIEADVHANTIFGGRPSVDKVAREMVERVRGGGTDAIVRTTISPEHSTALWGRVVTGTGVAIKFVAPCPNPQLARR